MDCCWYNDCMEGLTNEEARRRFIQYGPNILPEKRHFSAVSILTHQFTSPLIFVLLGAVVITLILGDTVDAAVIGMAVIINTILGFIQEYKAETTLAALKKILTPQAKVIRRGENYNDTGSIVSTGGSGPSFSRRPHAGRRQSGRGGQSLHQ